MCALAILELAVFNGTDFKSLLGVIGAGATLIAGVYGAYNLTCYSKNRTLNVLNF